MRISDWSSDVCSSDLSAALTTVWPRRVAIAMRFAPRNAKDCAFFVPLRSFRRPNDSIRRKFDSGHRPFIARAPKRVMINAGFAVTARRRPGRLEDRALLRLPRRPGEIGRAHG